MQNYKDNWNSNQRETIGIVALNSVDFVNSVFHYFDRDRVVVFLSSPTDNYKIQVTNVTEIVTPESKFGWCSPQFTPKSTSSLAQISFTSGTTGQPKGVLLTHRALNDVVERLNEVMEVDSSIREYVGVPANYSFGFGRCRAVATVGGQFYLPEYGFNPLEIRDLLCQGAINALSAVPSLWRTLFQCADVFGRETQAVKWIEIGSQYMSRAEKEKLLALFPQAKIVQHYGLTEASRSTFLIIDRTRGEHLESVGQAYGKTKVKISDDGKIAIAGPHVAETLLVEGCPQANIDERGWLITNDLGAIKDGYLYYLGRADDLINCGGVKVSPDDIEKSIRKTLNIHSGIAVARANDPVRGEAILVATLTSAGLDPQKVKQAAIIAAESCQIHSSDAIKLIDLEQFPTTATGKVQRNQLTQLYAAKMEFLQATQPDRADEPPDSPEDTSLLTNCEQEIIKVWKSVLNIENIDVNSNFFEIGGDSLTAISVMVRMEKLGISPQIAKGMLQGLSVQELARRIENHEDNPTTSHTIANHHTRTSMNINIVRGLLVLCVVFGHWYDGFVNILPSAIDAIKPFVSPIFSAGTPAFAIIYGISAGYSMFNIFQTDRSRLRKILASTFGILAGGIIILALLTLGEQLVVHHRAISLTNFAISFYSVLIYYLLITATLPFWFQAIDKSKNRVAKSIFISIALYCFYYYIVLRFNSYEGQGFLQLVKLTLVAKYSYFNLTAGTMSGIAIGLILREFSPKHGIPKNFLWVGAALIAAGFVICSHAGMSESWLVWPAKKTYLWAWLFYLGWVLLGLYTTHKLLLVYNRLSSGVKFILQAFSTIGVLAFPLFVTHEAVLPLKNIIAASGVPNSLSLVIAMSLFVSSFVFLFKKVYRANFTW
jgi:long-subunit acyl-CoA synthetase (AMP-forming)